MPVNRSRNVFMFALIAMLTLMACQNPGPAAPAAPTEGQQPVKGDDDDAPIIIASGSMYLSTDPDHILQLNSTDKRLEWADNMAAAVADYKVSSIDIYRYGANDGMETMNTYTVTADTTVEIDFCKNNCGGNPETIKLHYKSSGTPTITLEDNAANNGILEVKRLGKSHLWTHPKKHFEIDKVRVGGTPYPFDKGEGHVVIHVCKAGNCK